MKKIIVDNTFFNVKDTLECGQIFRFKPHKEGFLVCSLDKCAYVYNTDKEAVIECLRQDECYFYNYFDLDNDYDLIVQKAIDTKIPIVEKSARIGKGIRILKQDKIEMLFSFMISQNNNIPRIKTIINKLCKNLGERLTFLGEEYYSFPSVQKMAETPLEFYKEIGLGYRAEYVLELAKTLNNGYDFSSLTKLSTTSLKKELIKIKGIGEKVANCVLLFGFNRTDSFPVDTWIEKVYRENFNGEERDINKITKYFLNLFGDNSGYVQQYLFYYKRSIEKTEEHREK